MNKLFIAGIFILLLLARPCLSQTTYYPLVTSHAINAAAAVDGDVTTDYYYGPGGDTGWNSQLVTGTTTIYVVFNVIKTGTLGSLSYFIQYCGGSTLASGTTLIGTNTVSTTVSVTNLNQLCIQGEVYSAATGGTPLTVTLNIQNIYAENGSTINYTPFHVIN